MFPSSLRQKIVRPSLSKLGSVPSVRVPLRFSLDDEWRFEPYGTETIVWRGEMVKSGIGSCFCTLGSGVAFVILLTDKHAFLSHTLPYSVAISPT